MKVMPLFIERQFFTKFIVSTLLKITCHRQLGTDSTNFVVKSGVIFFSRFRSSLFKIASFLISTCNFAQRFSITLISGDCTGVLNFRGNDIAPIP